MSNITKLLMFSVFSFVFVLGINGCGKKQLKGDEPAGRSGIEGARGSTDPYLKATYFEYDQYTITEDQKDNLKSSADYLKKNPKMKVQLEGHTDERGTNEYNQGLGDRRASSVKKYLLDLGVDSTRVSTVSYGEERPAASGGNEGAWKKNRRAEFAVVSK